MGVLLSEFSSSTSVFLRGDNVGSVEGERGAGSVGGRDEEAGSDVGSGLREGSDEGGHGAEGLRDEGGGEGSGTHTPNAGGDAGVEIDGGSVLGDGDVDGARGLEQQLDGDLCLDEAPGDESPHQEEHGSGRTRARVKVGGREFVQSGMGMRGWPFAEKPKDWPVR